MANRPYKVCRLNVYEDKEGHQQEKWVDTGVLLWETRSGFRLQVPAHIMFVPSEQYMVFPPRDDDDRGRSSDRGGRDSGRSTRSRDDSPPTPEVSDEPLYDDDIPF